jgi:hypothetical protein
MVRNLIIAMVAAGAVAALLVSGSAAGHVQRALSFTVPPPAARDQKQVDVPPAGPSLGDQFIVAGSLRRHGQLFGRVLTLCEFNDATFQGEQCIVTLVLRNGTITAHTGGLDRRLPHAPPPGTADVLAVTGGTGSYAGANGTISIRHGRRADTLTVTLVE